MYVNVYSGNSINLPGENLKIYTQIGKNKYEKYILIMSHVQPGMSFSSENMWFPMPSDRLIFLTVAVAHGSNAGVGFFVTGYR